jgi:hypothetical protein
MDAGHCAVNAEIEADENCRFPEPVSDFRVGGFLCSQAIRT